MQELIQITTDGQGSSVVSARELHAFLEVKSKFADWIKNRIAKYQFQEDTDYVIVKGFSKSLEKLNSNQPGQISKNLESGRVILRNENNSTGGGRPEDDYALTLDMAKQLSMVENNTRGQQARRYFIDCEKKLRQVDTQTLHTLATQQRQIKQLRAEVLAISNRLNDGYEKPPVNATRPARWTTYLDRGDIMPPVAQKRPILPYYPVIAATRGEVSSRPCGQTAVAAIPAEVVSCILNLAYQDGLPMQYAELHSALAEAAPRIGWPLSKHKVETLIRRCVVEGYLIRFRPDGRTHPFYQPT